MRTPPGGMPERAFSRGVGRSAEGRRRVSGDGSLRRSGTGLVRARAFPDRVEMP